ncbi:MAG: DUF11 domain-containing protein [Chloroflexi bacterium]|nr:DUF11 domain-containing protein [Chloroflexota bacterium]
MTGLSVIGVAAQPGCTISGATYRDYNADGTQQAGEPGQAGVVARAYDATGQVVGTATSDASGGFSLMPTSTTEVRVEFSWPESFLYSGRRLGGDSSTTITFVDCGAGGATGINMGLSQPGQFCMSQDPELGTSCYIFGDQLNPDPSITNITTFVAFPSDTGATWSDRVGERSLANADEIGTTLGLGYHRSSGSFMAAAFLKRHTGFGPGGPGGIYRIPVGGGRPSLLINLNSVGINAGADPHPATTNDCPTPRSHPNCWLYEENAYRVIGKLSLGDLDVSEDDQSLYVVNLFSRSLHIIPLTLDGGARPAQIRTIGLTGLPGVTCPVGDQRPFGLGTHEGRVYVGIVCSAESSQNPADLRAYVYSFDPTGAPDWRSEVVQNGNPYISLDYARGCVDWSIPGGNCANASAAWNPWTTPTTWPPTTGVAATFPQPQLVDIVFDGDGNMILGFRDRFGDSSGFMAPDPSGYTDPGNELFIGITGGDILKACPDGSGRWALEDNGTCGGATTAGTGNNEGPGGGEYFFHDRNIPNVAVPSAGRHDEISMGSLVIVPGTNEVGLTVFDPLCESGCGSDPLFDGGVAYFNNDTGARVRSYRIYDGRTNQPPPLPVFGKANGLGDLEAVCGVVPLEIGNRIWEDLDRNGRQDPGELKLANVVVQLYMDQNGDGQVEANPIARTTTNADGEYYFNETNIFASNSLFPAPVPNVHFRDLNGSGTREDFEPVGVLADTVYEVRLDDPANYNGGPLTNYYITRANAATLQDGNDDARDSDGTNRNPAQLVSDTNFPFTRLTTRIYGDNDHTYDFGFALQPSDQITQTPPPPGTPGPSVVVGSFGISKVADPPFSAPGEEVAWTIIVTNNGDTPATNVTVIDRVPDDLEILSVPSNATVDGQTIRLTFAEIGPRSSVTVVIRTRIRDDIVVPFIIINEVSVEGGPTTQAQVLSVTRLPETGETPLLRWVLIGAAFMVLAVGGLLLARRRLDQP